MALITNLEGIGNGNEPFYIIWLLLSIGRGEMNALRLWNLRQGYLTGISEGAKMFVAPLQNV